MNSVSPSRLQQAYSRGSNNTPSLGVPQPQGLHTYCTHREDMALLHTVCLLNIYTHSTSHMARGLVYVKNKQTHIVLCTNTQKIINGCYGNINNKQTHKVFWVEYKHLAYINSLNQIKCFQYFITFFNIIKGVLHELI